MLISGRKQWGAQKPPVGVQINWGHSLARRLVGVWLFNSPFDSILQEKLAFSAGAKIGVNVGAHGLVCTATDDGAEVTTPTRLRLQRPLTVAVKVAIVGTPTVNGSFFGAVYDNTGVAPYTCYQLGVDVLGNYIFNFNNGAYANALSTVAPVIGARDILIGRIAETENLETLWQNRKEIGSNTVSVASIAYAASSLITAGDYTGISRNSNVVVEWGIIWNRYLLNVDLLALVDNPFALFMPQSPRLRYVNAVAAAPEIGLMASRQMVVWP